jgi:hypothetical protein
MYPASTRGTETFKTIGKDLSGATRGRWQAIKTYSSGAGPTNPEDQFVVSLGELPVLVQSSSPHVEEGADRGSSCE